MLRFEFNTSDLPEEEKEFFHDISLEFNHGQDFNIEEMTDKFRSFLLAMTYPQEVVSKVKVDGNYKTVNDDIIDREKLKNFMEGTLYHADE